MTLQKWGRTYPKPRVMTYVCPGHGDSRRVSMTEARWSSDLMASEFDHGIPSQPQNTLPAWIFGQVNLQFD